MKPISIFVAFLLPFCAQAQTVEFYTPRTVRIVKDNGQPAEKKSLVVIASPEKVKVSKTQQGTATIYKSSDLIVTVDGGKVSFADTKGNLLTREGACAFTPITQGPDQNSYKVKQPRATPPPTTSVADLPPLEPKESSSRTRKKSTPISNNE